MKKYLLSLASMMMGAFLFTSCLGDNKSDDTPQERVVTSGAYVINTGMWNKNNGSLTFFDYKSTSAVTTLVGGAGLGDTPNDAYLMGDTIFVVGSTDNTIFLVNRKTLSLIDYVSTIELMGEDGVNPRCITGYNNKLYFTTYGGYVGVLDPKNLSLEDKYKVGVAPEGLAFGGTESEVYLYVCNSNYGAGDGSISKIKIPSGVVVETIKNEKVQNPVDIITVGSNLYVLDWGYYTEDYSQQLNPGLYHISGNSATLLIRDATGMDAVLLYDNTGSPVGYEIVTFNYPYGSQSATYSKYNTASRETSVLTLSNDNDYKIECPAAIGVDPLYGYIVIAANKKDVTTGLADIVQPGFANMYDTSGAYITGSHFETGVGPHMIGFTLDKTVVTY